MTDIVEQLYVVTCIQKENNDAASNNPIKGRRESIREIHLVSDKSEARKGVPMSKVVPVGLTYTGFFLSKEKIPTYSYPVLGRSPWGK